MDPRQFDLPLFLALNEEYAARRVADPPTEPARLLDRTVRRAERVDALLAVRGKRVLDVGCGRGQLAHRLASEHGATVVGVDIEQYPEWAEHVHPNLTLRRLDLTEAHDLPPESFDVIYSYSVLEHVRHPFRMLQVCRALLAPGGRFLLVAHLYRSATGSHRSREVFFPWPHLLFTDDVFERFYESQGRPPQRPAWLNRLTHADYFRTFELLGYVVEKEFVRRRELDTAFYERFAEELSRYSIFDLTTNAVDVVLSVDRTRTLGTHSTNRLVRRSAIDAGLSVGPSRPSPGLFGRVAALLRTPPRPSEAGLGGLPGTKSTQSLVQREASARATPWSYWAADGSLAPAWDAGRKVVADHVDGSPEAIRVAVEDTATAYLMSKGGLGGFGGPAVDEATWAAPAAAEGCLTFDVTVTRGENPELWIIEYDGARRVAQVRQSLPSGRAEVRWRTSPRTRSMRLAIRLAGPASVVLGPVSCAWQ